MWPKRWCHCAKDEGEEEVDAEALEEAKGLAEVAEGR